MKAFAIFALTAVAVALPGAVDSQEGQLEARIYCPGRKPPICITKRAVEKRVEEATAAIACPGPWPWCITKRTEDKA